MQLNIDKIELRSDNKSGHVGVVWDKSKNKWKTEIKVNYKNIFLSYHSSFKEACEASDYARAYAHPFSIQARTINQSDIPQWIKDKVDSKLKNIA
jgi:hypothetical protein